MTEGMRNRTGCTAVCGDGAQRNPAGWGWIDSRVETRGEAEHRILRLHKLRDPWEGGRAPGGCYSDGEGARVGCRCSRAGCEGKSGRMRNNGTWRSGEERFRLHNELLGSL